MRRMILFSVFFGGCWSPVDATPSGSDAIAQGDRVVEGLIADKNPPIPYFDQIDPWRPEGGWEEVVDARNGAGDFGVLKGEVLLLRWIVSDSTTPHFCIVTMKSSMESTKAGRKFLFSHFQLRDMGKCLFRSQKVLHRHSPSMHTIATANFTFSKDHGKTRLNEGTNFSLLPVRTTGKVCGE